MQGKMNKTIKLPQIKNLKDRKVTQKAHVDPENIKIVKKKFVPLEDRFADMGKKTH